MVLVTVAARRVAGLVLALLAIVAVAIALRTCAARTPDSASLEGASDRPAGASASAGGSPAPSWPPPVTPTPVPSLPLPALSATSTAALAAWDHELDLAGIVVDADGNPVAGADVQAVFLPGGALEGSPWALPGPATRSGVDGTFGVRLLRGQRAGIRVTAEGFAACELRPAAAGSRVQVVMRPPVACVVTVHDAERRPVAGRRVHLVNRSDRRELQLHREAVSDANGRARFDELPAGFPVSAFTDSGTRSATSAAHVTLPMRGTVEVELSVPGERTLRGRVTDGATGLPIEGARVGASRPHEGSPTTNADGRYVLDSVPAPPSSDPYDEWPSSAPRLHVTADGYVTEHASLSKSSELDVVLQPAATVEGRVTDGGGRAIAYAWVFVEQRPLGSGGVLGMPLRWEATPSAMTDDAGRFRITARSRYRGLRVEAVGFAPLEVNIAYDKTNPGLIDVGDVVLTPGVTVSGHVRNGEGRPMSGVRVSIDGVGCTSDHRGHYVVRDVAPGRHPLRAVARGRDQLERTVTVAPDQQTTSIDVTFPAGREVTIDVRDESGSPVYAASLDVVGRSNWVSTDAEGRAVVVVPPGPWTVRAQAGGHRHGDGRRAFFPREAEIPADATQLTITLERTTPPDDMRPVAGTVVDDEGRPVEGVRLDVTWDGRGDPSQRGRREYSREDGGFAFRLPKDTVCDLRVDRRRRKDDRPMKGWPSDPWTGGLSGISAGSTDVVVIARPAPRNQAVTVIVRSPDGDPVAGARVRLGGWKQECDAARTDAEGRTELTGLLQRECYVSANPPAARRSEWLTARSGGFVPNGQEITVRYRRAARITGVTLHADGSPAARSYIKFAAGTTRESARTNRSGRFELLVDADAPLPWHLTAELTEEQPRPSVETVLTAPPTEQLTLRFPDAKQR